MYAHSLGYTGITVEDLRADPALRAEMRRTALKGSHPKRHLIKVLDDIEKEAKEQK